jgi:glutathione S-transferase
MHTVSDFPTHHDPPVLWHLKVSPYNEKVRWALDYKAVPHVRRAAMPGPHRAIARRLTGADTLPVLVTGGEAIGDSTRIIEALERRHPEPALYPDDPEERRRALEIEDLFDEELGPYLRLLVLYHALESPKLLLGMFFPGLPAGRRLLARTTFPVHRRRVIADFGIDEFSVGFAWGKVAAAGERFRAELRPSGYLVGDRFSIADLAVAAIASPVVAPVEFPYPQPQRGHPLFAPLRAALSESGLVDWTLDMYARHRGRSAEIPPTRMKAAYSAPSSAGTSARPPAA